MTSTAVSPTSFMYIAADVPEGQTLVHWRRDRDAARRAHRAFRLPRLRPGWWRA